MPTKLRDLRVVTEDWRLARVNRDDGGGARFHRIAAFAVESAEGEDDRVVALVSSPEHDAGELVSFDAGDEDAIAILEPGDDGAWTHDTANQMLEGEREEDRKKDEKHRAPKIAGELTDGERELLHAMVVASQRATTFVPTKSPAAVKDLFALTNYGVVAFDNHTSDRSARWYPTTLGFAVVAFYNAAPGRSS